jgi:hypothetical protein
MNSSEQKRRRRSRPPKRRLAGYSVRSLQLAFRRFRGTAPEATLRQIRLDARRATPVGTDQLVDLRARPLTVLRFTTQAALHSSSKQRLDTSRNSAAPHPLRQGSGAVPQDNGRNVTPPPADNCVFRLSVSLSVSLRLVGSRNVVKNRYVSRIRTQYLQPMPSVSPMVMGRYTAFVHIEGSRYQVSRGER